jgi:hypothetical protein
MIPTSVIVALAAQLQFKLKTFILRRPPLVILERLEKESAPCRTIVFNEENHDIGLSDSYLFLITIGIGTKPVKVNF